MAIPKSVQEIRRNVVETIIEDMKTHQFGWSEQWKDAITPYNAVSGKRYNGGNLLHLAAAARRNNYTDPRWVSFNQAKQAGWKIRKGAKSSKIEFWKMLPVDVEPGDTIDDLRMRPVCLGTWSVFNGSDVEGIPELEQHSSADFDDVNLFDLSDEFIAASRCPVRENGNGAFYSPTTDTITLPNRFNFYSAQAFLRTMLHEMAHSTGHPSALNREIQNRFGSEQYAMEELVAELSSIFTAGGVGLGFDNTSVDRKFYESHVAYLQSWVSAISDDPSVLFKAASAASKASDYILDRRKNVKAA